MGQTATHFTSAAARISESSHTAVTVSILVASRLRQWACAWALAVGGRVVDLRAQSMPVPWWVRVQHAIARWMVYRPVLDKIGFARIRVAWNGGSPPGAGYFKFFHPVGVHL